MTTDEAVIGHSGSFTTAPQLATQNAGRISMDFVLCILVVAYHAFPARMRGGFIGVDVFFVISGSDLLSLICQPGEMTFSLAEFYSRRLTYFPGAAMCTYAGYVFGFSRCSPTNTNTWEKHIAGGRALSFLLWNESGYFESRLRQSPFSPLELGIESSSIFWPLLLPSCGDETGTFLRSRL
jgi:peptidoglycan/LPS O-acetylase OafA/YrhL